MLNENLIIVLHRPRDVRNIGGVVRAMKNTGLLRLRLVEPAPFDIADITGIAHRAEDVLARLEVFADLDAALADVHHVVGTSARRRGARQARSDVRALAVELRARAEQQTLALLFGPEDNGLDNAALDRCHTLVQLPLDPAYPSLNLAQAVLLLTYELWMAEASPAARSQALPASAGQLETLFVEAETALQAIGFFKAGSTPTMRVLRQLAQRAELHEREIRLFTAIAREVQAVLARKP